MDHLQIIKQIESKQFEKIYFLHGEEAYYIDAITDAILKHALEDHERDFNQSIHYGKDTETLALISEAKGYPMMAERRVVVLKEAQDFKGMEDLLSYFEAPSDETVFVINYKYKTYDSRKKAMKAAAKNGLVFKSDKVPEYRLTDWISSFVKTKGFGITPKAAMLLAEFLGNDLSKIINELDKLAILVEAGTTINEIHIEENIGISKDFNNFELRKAVGEKHIVKANRIINYFAENPKNNPLVMTISLLNSFFTQVLQYHGLQSKDKMSVAKGLVINPYFVGDYVTAAKNYPMRKVSQIIGLLRDADDKNKGVGAKGMPQADILKELLFKIMH